MRNARIVNRQLHRWGAIAIAVPFLLVLVTGLLLQVKKQLSWVQPPELTSSSTTPAVEWETFLEAAKRVPQANVTSWDDIDRVDVRPGKGMAKVLAKSRWELQVDIGSGEVMQTAYRRSDLIEDLHTGGWFSDAIKLWFFLPAALVVTGLWVTGMYMALVHYRAVSRRHRVPVAGER